MENERKNTILDMMKDFLRYGYSFNSFLDFNYSICEGLSKSDLKSLWNKSINIMQRF